MAFLFSKDAVLGAAFIGFSISTLCLGALSMQTYTYFRRYPQDRPFYKALVAFIWILEFVDQAVVAHAVYFYLVTNWGEPLSLLGRPVWSLLVQVTLGAAAGTVVKACFAMRVWRFSNRNIWATGLILLLTFAQMATACVFTRKGFEMSSLADASQLRFVATLSLGIGVATDSVTAIALCIFLRKLRTGYTKDDSIVNRLSLFAVNTGALTSAFSLATLVTYDTMPSNFVYMGCYFVVSKLYANSFLATLNTRKVLRGRGTDGEHVTMPTFLMVGKITEQDQEDQDITTGSRIEVGVQREISLSRDPIPSYAVAW
ncbi:hypothetical protein BKA93DRAFT_791243 [Sparassis latifolia]